MPTATYRLEVNWSGSGAFAEWIEPGWFDAGLISDFAEDISPYVLVDEGIRWSYGRDRATQLTGRSTAGSLECVLNNNSGVFSSFNPESPLLGALTPGKRVRLTAYYDGTTYPLWSGILDSIEPDSSGWFRTARLRATGVLSFINDTRHRSTSVMLADVLTGDAIESILDDLDWPAADSLIDIGQTTMTRFFVKGQSGLAALRTVEDTEGGFLREGRSFEVIFEDRFHRLVSPHTVPQAVYSESSDEALWITGIAQHDPWSEIYNRFTAEVQLYSVGSVAVLWTLAATGADSPAIEPGASREFWAAYPNPQSPQGAVAVENNNWTTPVATTDFTANAAADGSGTNLTGAITVAAEKFANSMKVTLTNTSGTKAFVTFLQARGTPVLALDPLTVIRESAASIATYGERTWPNPSNLLPTLQEAEDWGDFNKSIYDHPVPVLSVALVANASAAHMVEVLSRDVSDRVTVEADGHTALGINGDFFIETAHHHLGEGMVHTVTYECSPAEAFGGFLVLDFGPGLDTARLAY